MGQGFSSEAQAGHDKRERKLSDKQTLYLIRSCLSLIPDHKDKLFSWNHYEHSLCVSLPTCFPLFTNKPTVIFKATLVKDNCGFLPKIQIF